MGEEASQRGKTWSFAYKVATAHNYAGTSAVAKTVSPNSLRENESSNLRSQFKKVPT